MNPFDEEYNRLVCRIINDGRWKYNERTGKSCLTVTGEKSVYDMRQGGFPALTTKKLYFKQMIAELLGFIRGVDNAADFRSLGCNFWDANANESKHWVENVNRDGHDDLGRIYGVQGRDWTNRHGEKFDQLKIIVDKLDEGIDDRRLIMNYWNPGELDEMALPPCHAFYQFHLMDNQLDLTMYQRSNDVPLGVPMNIASEALLLMLVAQITGHQVGKFTHMMGDVHIYEDQLDLLSHQTRLDPFMPPQMMINPDIKTLEDLETWVTTDDFELVNYEHHPAIQFPFSA
jgi:thymidylate synthase